MKIEILLDTIGQINDGYVEEAAPKTKIVRKYWFKWVALAACLCFLLVGIFIATIYDSDNNLIIQDQIIYGISNGQNSFNSYDTPPANGKILFFTDVKNALEEYDEKKLLFSLPLIFFSILHRLVL